MAEEEPTLPVGRVKELLDALTADSDADAAEVLARLDLPADAAASLEGRVRGVHSSLSRWQRRGRELSALFSSARELAELRDTDTLLDRLVERAHDLMGTDVTYLSEFHADNDELYVRSTLGAVTPEFRELRVPPGMGLASQVVRTRCPQWTSVYQGNVAIPHEHGIDAAVDAEGLVALLGVPMVANDRVLGVLFAANRSAHDFTPDEIALLSAFADHAAVVLHTTRLLERANHAAEEAERANAVLASNVTAMERASAVHEDLTAVVLQGGSVDGVADTLSKALDRPVLVLDGEMTAAAQAGDAVHYKGTDGKLLPAVRDAIDESRLTARCVPVGGDVAVAVAVVAAEAFLGAVLVGHGGLELRAVDRRTIERAAQISALVAVNQEAVAAAEDRVRGELVTDILRAEPARWRELVLRARARNVRLDQLTTVVVVALPSTDAHRAVSDVIRGVVPAGLVGDRDGVLAVLAPTEDPLATAREVWSALRATLGAPVLAVAGPTVRQAEALGQSYDVARRCVHLLHRLDRMDAAVDARAYEPYLAMFGAGSQQLTGFVDATIGPVLRWDEERGTELFSTLAAFADAGASPTRTARAMNVHINTVTQRLDRIGALLGPDWREPEPLFRISVAARLHALAD